MSKINKFIHKLCAIFATILALIFIDLPIKILLIIVFLLLSILLFFVYPLSCRINWPNWASLLYYYSFSTKMFVANKVWDVWNTYYKL